MQSIAEAPASTLEPDAQPDTARRALAADVYALVSHMMRNSQIGALDTIAELELSFTQIKTLYAIDLAEQDPCLKALAESMGVSLATMSRTVDGLFERGLLDRAEDPEDRRMKRVRLTDGGREVTATLNRSRLLGIQEFVQGISEQEAAALAGALEPLISARPEIAERRPEQGGSL